MRYIFSENHKYELWRKIWVALAEVQSEFHLVSKEELLDLKKNEKNIHIDRILEFEKDTKHDVMAAIREFAEKAKIGGGKIHLGATSMDIVDNADAIRINEGLEVIEKKLINVLKLFSNLIRKYSSLACLGYTHLQPAEPTTVGYRLSFYAQDVWYALDQIKFAQITIKAKGMRGAVGTSASYQKLLKNKKIDVFEFEKKVMNLLGLESVLIANQVYPRQFDFITMNALVSTSSSLAKFAGDLRLLQSPSIGEWSEPFSKNQVGSSAMPFKKNPINSENICSLARYIASLPTVAIENNTHSYLERTLDDSANKRIIIAEVFLATDQILMTAEKILSGLIINKKRIAYNLNLYGSFAATEAILMAAVKKGVDRQKMHEILRGISMYAWKKVQEGKLNPMEQLLLHDKRVRSLLSKDEIEEALEVENYIGDAPKRAILLVQRLRKLFYENK